MFGEDVTIQMLDLVTEAAGSHLFSLYLKPVAIPVLGFYLDPHGAKHITPASGNGETPLQAILLPLLLNDFRVYQLQHFTVFVDYDHRPAKNTYLGGGQTGAGGVCQGFLQIIQ